MTQVNPFAGLRYNPARISNLADVISPPYDKISPVERAELWNRSEYNVVRLILPPPSDQNVDVATQSTDRESQSWYADAAARLNDWISQGIFQVDFPQMYVYRQTYVYDGKIYTRSGLFGALQLGEGGGPLAHEHTFEGPKADRLRLTRAAKANLSSIFLLADGGNDDWERLFQSASTVLIEFQDREGQHHSLHSLAEPSALGKTQEFLLRRTLVIADGHHRYETAQNYCREMQKATGKDPQNEPWGYVLALIVPIESPGLTVLPTHRVLSNLPPDWAAQLKNKAQEFCSLSSLGNASGPAIAQALQEDPTGDRIAVVGKNEAFWLQPRPGSVIPALQESPAALRELNVTILHRFVFEYCLGLTPDDLAGRIRYIRGEEPALQIVKSGEADAVFLLRGISPQQVFALSQKGVKMPQKSTDFYPKIPTGLVLRSLVGADE